MNGVNELKKSLAIGFHFGPIISRIKSVGRVRPAELQA